jgi:hypothetical protein
MTRAGILRHETAYLGYNPPQSIISLGFGRYVNTKATTSLLILILSPLSPLWYLVSVHVQLVSSQQRAS